ncbi:hypothetical protein Btru_038890 [Bulinus truncatus]|nr:hypothetical protein Btru_038890 [Bulinus truncatus]
MEDSEEWENDEKIKTTFKSSHIPLPCKSSGNRRCMDGSCIASVDLCPEELHLNQNTIIIMLVIGMTVLIFLLILYCYKQRSHHRREQNNNNQQTVNGDDDNISLNMPPPSYEEVVSSNLYPVTPVFQRDMRTSYCEEPRTPPPNYEAALDILAHSNETILPSKSQPFNPVVRRSVSTEFSNAGKRSVRSTDIDFRRVFSNPDQR